MQNEIEVLNLKFLETWSLKYFVKKLYIYIYIYIFIYLFISMLKLPLRDFGQNVSLIGA